MDFYADLVFDGGYKEGGLGLVCFRFYWENCVVTWTLNEPSVYSGLILNVMDMAEYAQALRVIEENS